NVRFPYSIRGDCPPQINDITVISASGHNLGARKAPPLSSILKDWNCGAWNRSGYIILLPVMLLQQLHLVLQSKLEFFQPDFFYFFVFAEETFLDERIEALRVLGVFLSQPTKIFVA